MASPFLGEIKVVGFNFPPNGYAFCNGQVLPIAQNTALFSLLGTTYGGNGQTTFALPNLQNAAPMHWGNGPGLTPRTIGEVDGSASVTVTVPQLPAHNHALNSAILSAPNAAQNVGTPTAQAMIGTSNPNQVFSDATSPVVPMSPLAIGQTGGNQPHENRSPILALNFVIALQGIFPSRN